MSLKGRCPLIGVVKAGTAVIHTLMLMIFIPFLGEVSSDRCCKGRDRCNTHINVNDMYTVSRGGVL